MARKAIVRTSDGLVVNVILLEDGAKWTPPDGCEVRDAFDAGPGDTWDGFKYVNPVQALPTPAPEHPIIGMMDAVLKGRGLAGLTQAERDGATKALGG